VVALAEHILELKQVHLVDQVGVAILLVVLEHLVKDLLVALVTMQIIMAVAVVDLDLLAFLQQ
jgi:hypothetical protein